MGPGARDETGKFVPLDVKAGDRVLFGKWSGTEVKIDGEDLLIMKESDALGVLEGKALGARRSLMRSSPANARSPAHHVPMLGIEAQGSCCGSADPFCRISMEMLSGERMKAICPSRGGRLMVMPASRNRWQNA